MKYQLGRKLGTGGMAEVYRASVVGAAGIVRSVAIKRVLRGFARDERFVKMFAEEARLSARLQHPNIVAVTDFDRDEQDRPFLVMELVDGPTLEALTAAPLVRGVAVFVIEEVLRALVYAHDQGVVHRDLSPHNVLVSWHGEVKLTDFGIAKARTATQATATELVKGKPAYMSPEQANAEPLDGRSDLFGVGVMLWELLAGRPLFAGVTTHETLARLMFGPIEAPPGPEDLVAVTMRLLARSRDDRYPDARAALEALTACNDHPADGAKVLRGVLDERFDPAMREREELDGTALGDVRQADVNHVMGRRPITPDSVSGVRRRLVWLGVAAVVVVAVVAFVVTRGDRATRVVGRDATVPADASNDAFLADALPQYADPFFDLAALIAQASRDCPWPKAIELRVALGVKPDGTMRKATATPYRAGRALTGRPAYVACIERLVLALHYPASVYGMPDQDYDLGPGTAP